MALLVASNGCIGEKIEDKIDKICHIVTSDVIKLDFWQFVVTSQGERK